MPTDQVRLVSLNKLKPQPKNARTHSKKQVQQIANSIERFGFTNPILVDEKNAVLAGHGRLAAAKLMTMLGKRWRRYESLSISECYTARPYQASVLL
jgi:ParB-like nuclease domain